MKAKKILAGACASVMLAMTTATAVSAAETVKVTVGNTEANAGGTFSVTLDLADIPAAGINACDFGIEYDASALTITNVTAGALAKDDTASLEGVDAFDANIESGLVSVIYGLGTTDSAAYMTGSGTFLTLEGTVSTTAAAGTYDLKVVAVDRLETPSGTATNADIIFGNLGEDNITYTVYTPTITDGYVKVVDGEEPTGATDTTNPSEEKPTVDPGKVTKRGDVDCNGEVGIADIAALAKWIPAANLYPVSEEGLANAEVTDDGEVNASDLTKIIEFLTNAITEL